VSAPRRFGQPSTAIHNPFGTSAVNNINNSNSNNPFASVPATPFGRTTNGPPAPNSLTFGVSSNSIGPTALATTNPFPPIANNSNNNTTGTQWRAPSSSAATFAKSNNRVRQSKQSPQKILMTPFGPPVSTTTAVAAGDSDDGMTDADDFAMNHSNDTKNSDNGQVDNEDNDPAKKLAKLKAKLAQKKLMLVAKNQQKQEVPRDRAITADNELTLNPQANPFQPSVRDSDTQALNPQARVFHPASSSNNENPFTQYRGNDKTPSETTTRMHLPPDLLQLAANTGDASNSATTSTTLAKTRETLETASSLVGTCKTMCPDEEILRRERESDIQLLERIDHNSIHPKDWTLRDTMVKRFRRSAADFKLDVPEWVRPPDVLERVCGYLEEWIMERDRQGPDPRYDQQNQTRTPLPLDVYQFIWDRTRMVRKDFTLQNYVGGKSGHCDARAVRCHERMARWHCLCEHQLSHIPEFQSQQSQQNLQELGQTLKSLNQYYDDTMCRSLVEVADEKGNEQRVGSEASSNNHGCRESTIQGPTPVDYNGNTIEPKASDQCFVGTSTSSSHGTAEPEMRGLYILQTMMNEADSGLEITRFALNLLQNRPEVYYSAPVQLALTIFKVSLPVPAFSSNNLKKHRSNDAQRPRTPTTMQSILQSSVQVLLRTFFLA
jgi:SAC3/GANP family